MTKNEIVTIRSFAKDNGATRASATLQTKPKVTRHFIYKQFGS
jgi:hypothetical protein